jgi:hypothetical protein
MSPSRHLNPRPLPFFRTPQAPSRWNPYLARCPWLSRGLALRRARAFQPHSRRRLSLASALAFGLPLAFALLTFSAAALTVTVGSPSAGTWTGSDTVGVTGTASGPNSDRRVLDTTADFAGGAEINVSTAANQVTLVPPANQTYRYFQDFTGLVNASHIDEHWIWNLTGLFWQVSNIAALSSTPPSLAHSGIAPEYVFWNTLLPGGLLDGRLSFRYMCQANGFLNAWASPDGSAANLTPILATALAGQTTLDYNLTSSFAGARALYVKFIVGASTAASSFCSIDDFEVVANTSISAASRVSFFDDFTPGANMVWNGWEGFWAVGNATGTSDTLPSLYHLATGSTSVIANWGSATAIVNATLSFHYQCEANAALQAFLGTGASSESRILNGARGAGHTVFSINATPYLAGGKGVYLRFASDATSTPTYFCGVDDVAVSWNVTGFLPYTYTGIYSSPSVDLGYPAALTTADWVAAVPANSSISVSFRSSSNNVSYSAWQPLAASGAPVSPTGARFVQFRVDFTSFGGVALAVVDRLGVNFSALAKVELSVNGGAWATAVGTGVWNGTVALAGGSNNITARVTDSTGATASSVVQVSRDTFNPSSPGRPAGPAVTNLTSATWTWSAATDVGLGVDHYLVDVGLAPFGQELGATISTPGPTYTFTGLPDNVRVYLTAFAVDGAGLVSLAGNSSDATLVDRTAPGPVGIQPPPAFTRNNSISWSWAAATDFGSGVGAYLVSIGTTPGASDAAFATTTLTNFSFPNGQGGSTYFFTVAPIDNAGNVGPTSTAGGVTVDQTAPVGPGAVMGPAAVTNLSTLTWSWPAATDVLSGVDHYFVSVGTSAGGSDIAGLVWSAATYTVSFVPSGARYYFEVRAVDRAGNAGAPSTASPVLVDDAAPTAPVIHPVASFIANLTEEIAWDASTDQPPTNASGVDHYVIRIAQGAAVRETTSIGLSVIVPLDDGANYTVSVSSVDRAGNEGSISSVAFTADRSGPAAPAGLKLTVVDAAGPSFAATWDGTSDAGAGLKQYKVNIGTTPGGTQVAAGRAVTGTRAEWTGSFDTTYYVTVWGVDNLGNAGPTNSTTEGVVAKKPGTTGGGFLPGLETGGALSAMFVVAVAASSRKRR